MKCPGQDTQYWKPGAIYEEKCPECGHAVEFFKDDTSRKCGHCGHRFVNPRMDFGCAAYCQYAEQCIGTLPAEVVAEQENLLKDRVAVEVKRFLKRDFHRIGHATRTARWAEQLGKAEGGNLAVILCASHLLAVGAQTARTLLEKLGARDALIETVCDTVERALGSTVPDSLEVQVVSDADRLASLEEQQKDADASDPLSESFAPTDFHTDMARQEARRRLELA
jgi:DNA-directed RNA polymerase subunit RPC12/RpoP